MIEARPTNWVATAWFTKRMAYLAPISIGSIVKIEWWIIYSREEFPMPAPKTIKANNVIIVIKIYGAKILMPVCNCPLLTYMADRPLIA